MSNNKQSMKLYTEEQLMKTWNTAFTEALKLDEEDYMPTFYGEFINKLTPIKLPSDDEIEEMGKDVIIYNDTKRGWFIEGLKFMRNKIQGGNNEQQ